MKKVVTRFAPSPTGTLHIGGVRTALFNFVYARQNNGKFLVRIEDTDRERSTKEFENNILENLSSIGLDPDEKPINQSERNEIYINAAEKILESGHAYWCDCSADELEIMRKEQSASGKKPMYDGRSRDLGLSRSDKTVLRLATPEKGEVIVNDLIRGKIRFNNNELDDLILLRSDGSPTYHLCNVVDDYEQGVTTVIRGEDHILEGGSRSWRVGDKIGESEMAALRAVGFTTDRHTYTLDDDGMVDNIDSFWSAQKFGPKIWPAGSNGRKWEELWSIALSKILKNCSDIDTLTACGGILYDSGGPDGSYINNENHSITIYPENQGEYVSLFFSSFQLESCCDYLTIYDGVGVSSPVLQTGSNGTSLNGLTFYASPTNESGALTITFTTDGSITFPGFSAEIGCTTYGPCFGFDVNVLSTFESEEGAGDASASLDIILGNEPFEILWSTGDTTSSINDLSAGNYSVSITQVILLVDFDKKI